MKLTIERSQLLKSLAHVQSVVEKRNTIPILSNVKLDAENGCLRLSATDLDVEFQEKVVADVVHAGSTTAPAHTLFDIVKKLPDGSQVEIEFTADMGLLTLRSGRSKFSLACLPAEDFPALSAGQLAYTFDLGASELKALIDRTRFAVSTEETRYYLNGIYLHAATGPLGDVLRAAATDGHRLARTEVTLPTGAVGMPGIIVPRKTVNEVYKLIGETEESITLSLSETKIRFTFGEACLTSKLIDGTFPDYERVIPVDNDKNLEVPVKTLAAAVDRVAAISTEKSRAIKLTIGAGLLTLSASSPESGTATEEVEAEYSATPLDIGFNSRYLLDILSQLDGEKVCFSMADSSSPTVVQDAADRSAVYVLMPMRV